MTIKKAIVTLRTAWNWGMQHELIQRPFPNKGLKYPKAKEKPPFQTLAEVERLTKRLPAEEAAELWECVFLTLPDIKDLLKHVKATACQPFLYPLPELALGSPLSQMDGQVDLVSRSESREPLRSTDPSFVASGGGN